MGELKKLMMDIEEELIRRAYQDWEIEKMLREMALDELLELTNLVNQEVKTRKESSDENSATS